MPTESVELIIAAKNKATAAFKSAEKDQKSYEKALGRVGQATHQSTAALNVMLQIMGQSGGKIGEIISNIAVFKGSLDALKDAQKNNGTAFDKLTAKAGMFVAAFQVGFAIGDFFSGAAEEAKKLNDELEKSRDLSSKLISSMQRNQATEEFKISLIEDPEEQIAALERLQKQQEKNRDGAIKNRNSAKKSFDVYNTWENNWLQINKSMQTVEKERYEESRKQVESYQSGIQSLTTQINQLELATEAARKKEAADKTAKDREEALKREIELKKEAEAAAKKQIETDRNYVEALKLQLIELRDGKKAAEDYKNERSGVSDAARAEGDQYRRQIELINKRNELQAKAKAIIEANLTPLQKFKRDYETLASLKLKGLIDDGVFEKELKRLQDRLPEEKKKSKSQFIANTQDSSRFLARGRGINPILQTNENTKKTADLVAESNKIMKQVEAKLASIDTNTAQAETVLS